VAEVSGPDWLNDSFAAVMVVVALYSAGRVVAARRWGRPSHADVDSAHVLMGVAMAGLLSSAINPAPDGVALSVQPGYGSVLSTAPDTGDRSGGGGAGPSVTDASPWLAPRLEAACHIAMCIAMGYMLVLIL
jgi:hypothetical protein